MTGPRKGIVDFETRLMNHVKRKIQQLLLLYGIL